MTPSFGSASAHRVRDHRRQHRPHFAIEHASRAPRPIRRAAWPRRPIPIFPAARAQPSMKLARRSRRPPAPPGKTTPMSAPTALWWMSFASRLMMPYLKVVEKRSMCAPMRDDHVGLRQRPGSRSSSRCGRAARATAGAWWERRPDSIAASPRECRSSPRGACMAGQRVFAQHAAAHQEDRALGARDQLGGAVEIGARAGRRSGAAGRLRARSAPASTSAAGCPSTRRGAPGRAARRARRGTRGAPLPAPCRRSGSNRPTW